MKAALVLIAVLVVAVPAIGAGLVFALAHPTLAQWRDIIIIVVGVAGAAFFCAAIVVTIATGFATMGLVSAVRAMLDDSVKPALESVREAADTVRGTAEFVGKTAVTPILRTYGTVAGVRRGLSVLAGLNKRRGAK